MGSLKERFLSSEMQFLPLVNRILSHKSPVGLRHNLGLYRVPSPTIQRKAFERFMRHHYAQCFGNSLRLVTTETWQKHIKSQEIVHLYTNMLSSQFTIAVWGTSQIEIIHRNGILWAMYCTRLLSKTNPKYWPFEIECVTKTWAKCWLKIPNLRLCGGAVNWEVKIVHDVLNWCGEISYMNV